MMPIDQGNLAEQDRKELSGLIEKVKCGIFDMENLNAIKEGKRVIRSGHFLVNIFQAASGEEERLVEQTSNLYKNEPDLVRVLTDPFYNFRSYFVLKEHTPLLGKLQTTIRSFESVLDVMLAVLLALQKLHYKGVGHGEINLSSISNRGGRIVLGLIKPKEKMPGVIDDQDKFEFQRANDIKSLGLAVKQLFEYYYIQVKRVTYQKAEEEISKLAFLTRMLSGKQTCEQLLEEPTVFNYWKNKDCLSQLDSYKTALKILRKKPVNLDYLLLQELLKMAKFISSFHAYQKINYLVKIDFRRKISKYIDVDEHFLRETREPELPRCYELSKLEEMSFKYERLQLGYLYKQEFEKAGKSENAKDLGYTEQQLCCLWSTDKPSPVLQSILKQLDLTLPEVIALQRLSI